MRMTRLRRAQEAIRVYRGTATADNTVHVPPLAWLCSACGGGLDPGPTNRPMLHFCDRPGRIVPPYLGFSEEFLGPLREGARAARDRWRALRATHENAEEREKLPEEDKWEGDLRTLYERYYDLAAEAEIVKHSLCGGCKHPRSVHIEGHCRAVVPRPNPYLPDSFINTLCACGGESEPKSEPKMEG